MRLGYVYTCSACFLRGGQYISLHPHLFIVSPWLLMSLVALDFDKVSMLLLKKITFMVSFIRCINTLH